MEHDQTHRKLNTVLLYTSPARGHLYPLMPTLRALRERGHRVCVCTLASEVELCRVEGLEAKAIATEIENIQMDDYLGQNDMARIQRAYEVFTRRAALEVNDLQSVIDELKPDLLLIDINALGAQLVGGRGDLPWAVFSPYLLPVRGEGVPPFGPGLAPMPGALGKLRDFIVGKAVAGMLNKAGLARYNKVREQAGLAPVDDVVNHSYATPPLLLAYTPQCLDYRREYPANVVSLGGSNWGPGDDNAGAADGNEQPAILVTTSSEYQGDEVLARMAIVGLADESEELIVTVPALNPSDFSAKANVRVERFIDHAPILSRASVVVTHGGMGSTQKALAAGVPVVVVPFGRDQLEVAQRVVYAGVGVALSAKKLTAKSLRDAVRKARGMSAAAQQMAAEMKQAPGANGAADALESLMRPKTLG